MNTRKDKGFTLIEVMIVVVIIAVLATIAIPSYRNYVLKANRTEAKSALMQLAARQEKHFLSYNQYATSLGSPASATKLNFPTTTEHDLYTISSAIVGPYVFLRAQYKNGQTADTPCRQFLFRLPDNVRFSKDSNLTSNGNPDPCW